MYAMTVTLHIEFWKLHGNLGYRKKLSTNLLVIVRNIAVQVLCLRRCGRISSCTTAISRTLWCRNAASWVHRSPCAPVPSPAIQRWTHVKHTRPVVKLEVVVCESVQEPPGQVLAKIWAFKAWLNQPITGQVQVQVQVGLWNFLKFIISWNFPEISGNFRKISENISKSLEVKTSIIFSRIADIPENRAKNKLFFKYNAYSYSIKIWRVVCQERAYFISSFCNAGFVNMWL